MNKIAELTDGIFEGLVNLEGIDFYNNQIEVLNSNIRICKFYLRIILYANRKL